MRYPWWGPGGAHPRTTLAVIPSAFFCHSERSRRTSRCSAFAAHTLAPLQPSEAYPRGWNPTTTQSSSPPRPRRQPPPVPSPPTVLPHPDAVSMVGPGRRTAPRTTLAVIPSAFFCHSERSRRISRPCSTQSSRHSPTHVSATGDPDHHGTVRRVYHPIPESGTPRPSPHIHGGEPSGYNPSIKGVPPDVTGIHGADW